MRRSRQASFGLDSYILPVNTELLFCRWQLLELSHSYLPLTRRRHFKSYVQPITVTDDIRGLQEMLHKTHTAREEWDMILLLIWRRSFKKSEWAGLHIFCVDSFTSNYHRHRSTVTIDALAATRRRRSPLHFIAVCLTNEHAASHLPSSFPLYREEGIANIQGCAEKVTVLPSISFPRNLAPAQPCII